MYAHICSTRIRKKLCLDFLVLIQTFITELNSQEIALANALKYTLNALLIMHWQL